MSITEYFAVPDPSDPTTMTYWVRKTAPRERSFGPWPTKAHYGPRLKRSDIPPDVEDRRAFVRSWYRTNFDPWFTRVQEAITDDPGGCRARFAVFATRCVSCGRALTDPRSKVLGIGPECRAGVPDDVIDHLARRIAKLHAERTAA